MGSGVTEVVAGCIPRLAIKACNRLSTAAMTRQLVPLAAFFATLCALMLPHIAVADAADIDAAARGVVRVLIVGVDEEGETFPISHGSGFAISRDRIVTNNHVVQELRTDPRLRLLIVPGDGGEASPAQIVSYSPRNDLALIQITGDLRLPPLTIAGAADADSGDAYSVGYPQNVDIAQGLGMGDVFRATPPVKARGALAGRRPSREFDTILHTAPIARGSSGGPLLDTCGRVVGVNSFGASSSGADAEFFFAVSMRELLPFLRANDVQPRVNAMPCRSLAELDAEDQRRADEAARIADDQRNSAASQRAEAEDDIRREVERDTANARDNGMAIAAVLIVLGLIAGFAAYQLHTLGKRNPFIAASAIAVLAVIGALVAWFSRPQLSSIDDRVAMQLEEQIGGTSAAAGGTANDGRLSGDLVCTVDPQRSRITGASAEDLPFEWGAGGCVNDRTQYGLLGGQWSRVFVPNEEAVVSINRFDPARGEYRMERYLLGATDMAEAREARGTYSSPACGIDEDAASAFGQQQDTVLALLPDSPNERIIYECSEAGR